METRRYMPGQSPSRLGVLCMETVPERVGRHVAMCMSRKKRWRQHCPTCRQYCMAMGISITLRDDHLFVDFMINGGAGLCASAAIRERGKWPIPKHQAAIMRNRFEFPYIMKNYDIERDWRCLAEQGFACTIANEVEYLIRRNYFSAFQQALLYNPTEEEAKPVRYDYYMRRAIHYCSSYIINGLSTKGWAEWKNADE